MHRLIDRIFLKFRDFKSRNFNTYFDMLSVQFSSKNSFLSIFDILNVTKCQKSPIQVMHRLIDKIFLNSVNSSLGILLYTLTCYMFNFDRKIHFFQFWTFWTSLNAEITNTGDAPINWQNIFEIRDFKSRNFKTYFDMVSIQSGGKIHFIQFLTFLTSLRSEITDWCRECFWNRSFQV